MRIFKGKLNGEGKISSGHNQVCNCSACENDKYYVNFWGNQNSQENLLNWGHVPSISTGLISHDIFIQGLIQIYRQNPGKNASRNFYKVSRYTKLKANNLHGLIVYWEGDIRVAH
jgi:hypothetical protein